MQIKIGSVGTGAKVQQLTAQLNDVIGEFVVKAGYSLGSVVKVAGKQVDLSRTFSQESIGEGSFMIVSGEVKTSGAIDLESLSPEVLAELEAAIEAKKAAQDQPIEVNLPTVLWPNVTALNTTLVDANTTIMQYALQFVEAEDLAAIELEDGSPAPIFAKVQPNVTYIIRTR